MGKITMDLAAMFPQTFGDKDALRRAELSEQLQRATLNSYTQNQQEKDIIRSNQVLPNENFKIDANGDTIPFASLPREQKEEWVRQKQMDWQIQQQANYTKSKANLAAAEIELEQNLQKKNDIATAKAGWMGGEKPGPDWLPGALFGKSYAQQTKDIENKIASTEEKRNIAGMKLQSIQSQQMPANYGVPSVVSPSQPQPASQMQQQTQPAVQPQQAVPTYKSRDEAINAGAKAGDIVYIQGVGKVRMR
jgi:hypothetical protein